MSWASGRRSLIAGGALAIAAAFLSILAFVSWHETPSCTDGKQNQGEEGIDCGGSCAYLCRESVAPPSVRFVRALSGGETRTDVIAYIDNPNPRAALKDARFTIELFAADGTVLFVRQGTIDLPPAATIPVFASDFPVSLAGVTRAFFSFEEESLDWIPFDAVHTMPRVTDTALTLTPTPRLTALAVNDLPYTVYTVGFVATIFDTNGNVLAASQTALPRIPGTGTERLVFTWNTAFDGEAGRIEVTPVLSLPRP